MMPFLKLHSENYTEAGTSQHKPSYQLFSYVNKSWSRKIGKLVLLDFHHENMVLKREMCLRVRQLVKEEHLAIVMKRRRIKIKVLMQVCLKSLLLSRVFYILEQCWIWSILKVCRYFPISKKLLFLLIESIVESRKYPYSTCNSANSFTLRSQKSDNPINLE